MMYLFIFLLIGSINVIKSDDVVKKTSKVNSESDATVQGVSVSKVTANKNAENASEIDKVVETFIQRAVDETDRKISTTDSEIDDVYWEFENTSLPDTRRILYGKQVGKGKRPYMVYLQLTKDSAKAHKYRGWLCGGVILSEKYVLTSAACVEDADQFYVVSGTRKFVDSFDYKSDNCVCKQRRRVVWKCIPKNYKFDFEDSIKWSSNDIAIVRVDKPFKFGVKEEGCEFAVCPIKYNNVSKELEKAGTRAYIAGWGTMGNFREGVYKRADEKVPENAKCIQEAKVCIMDNEQCAKKWAQRFRPIITQYMICTKDVEKRLSEICEKKYANCTDIEIKRRASLNQSDSEADPEKWNIDIGRHLRDPTDYAARRSSTGGFCENDHGGPLVVKYKKKEYVIGIISACKIDPKSHNCHGPFLYTSIFYNRQFISCAVNKDIEQGCRRVFRTGITHEEYVVDWSGIKEDDDNDKISSGENVSADSSDDDIDNIEILRGSSNNKEKVAKTETELKTEVTESSKKADSKEVKEASKADHKSSKSRKGKKKSGNKKSKSKSETTKTNDKENKDVVKKDKDPKSYESSSDEKVNKPQE